MINPKISRTLKIILNIALYIIGMCFIAVVFTRAIPDIIELINSEEKDILVITNTIAVAVFMLATGIFLNFISVLNLNKRI